MNEPHYGFRELFEQLGLPSDDAAIQDFITAQGPLPEGVLLADAACWTPAQSRFLREAIGHDAEWAQAVDQLSVALRAS